MSEYKKGNWVCVAQRKFSVVQKLKVWKTEKETIKEMNVVQENISLNKF